MTSSRCLQKTHFARKYFVNPTLIEANPILIEANSTLIEANSTVIDGVSTSHQVRADGVAWSGTLVLDFLPRLPPVRGADGAWGIPAVDPSELLHMGCDASGDAMMGATALSRLPKTLQALG